MGGDEKHLRSAKRGWGCLPIVGGLVLVALVGSKLAQLNQPAAPSASGRHLANDKRATEEWAARTVGENSVRATLKDPSSAVFVGTHARVVGGEHVACGYVNARNSFGAMAGAQPWLVNIERSVVLVKSPENGSRFVRLWNRYCAGEADSAKPMRRRS